MRPNIKANTWSNLYLSGSGRRLPNCFGFTIGYSLNDGVPNWGLEIRTLAYRHGGLTWCVASAF